MKSYFQKLLLVFAALIFFAGCTINTTVKGKVTSTEGDPIVGATVNVSYSNGTYTATTKEEGKYRVKATLPLTEETIITASMDGYITDEQSVLISHKYKKKAFVQNFTLQAEEPEVVIEYGSISGTVKDIAGNVISDATITIGSQTATTGVSGIYTVSNIEVASKVSVTITKDGYSLNSNVIDVNADETSTLDFVLVENDVTLTIDSTIDNSVVIKDAAIDFAANSFVLEDGTLYNGNVTVEASFHQPSSLIGRLAFPGEYAGTRTDGSTSLLQSYGFFNVELFAQDGSKLNLASGTTATLTYPADVNLIHDSATMPLWYYDTTLGTWVEEGVATYNDVTNTYEGTVSHFTVWNLDKPYPKATVSGIVTDTQGNPVSGACMRVVATSYYYQNVCTNEEGNFNLIVPTDLSLNIIAIKDAQVATYGVDNLTEDEVVEITMVLGENDILSNINLTGQVFLQQNGSLYTGIHSTFVSTDVLGQTYNSFGNNFTISNILIDDTTDTITLTINSSILGEIIIDELDGLINNGTFYSKEITISIPDVLVSNTINIGKIILDEDDISESEIVNPIPPIILLPM